ncbi:MAG TPA: hypothetical protein VNA27_02990 [Rubrobacteraceae bacterium]|nr:hypothetical protein [Rubrobacteraceae bacterium]
MDRSPEDLGLAPDLSLLPAEVRDLILHGNRGQYPTHSEAAAAVCVELLRAAYGASEVWTVLSDPTNGISKVFFTKGGEQGEAWLERITYEAHEAVARSGCDEQYHRFVAEHDSDVETSVKNN